MLLEPIPITYFIIQESRFSRVLTHLTSTEIPLFLQIWPQGNKLPPDIES